MVLSARSYREAHIRNTEARCIDPCGRGDNAMRGKTMRIA